MQYGLARLSLFPSVQVDFVAAVAAWIGMALVFATLRASTAGPPDKGDSCPTL